MAGLLLCRMQQTFGWRSIFSIPGDCRRSLRGGDGASATTPLRDTLARQTGMYRVAAKITDEQADDLIGELSAARMADVCARSSGSAIATARRASTLLPPQKFDPRVDQTGRGEAAIPLLCQEACNLLVAEARKVVKAAE